MSHCELILQYLRDHGYQATLGELLDYGRYSFGHKLTARLSDLRKKGFNIVYVRGETPSKNVYKLIENQDTTNDVKAHYDNLFNL